MSFLIESWNILCELAPWLLLGMLLSGCLHVLLPEGFIERQLNGAWGVVQAVFLGVPLPLCSCGVIPAGIGLKNQGASHGASMGFLISTPQTGVDSILVAASFFGWPFAIFKMVSAGLMGVIGGWLTDSVVAQPQALDAKSDDARDSLTSGNLPVIGIVEGPPGVVPAQNGDSEGSEPARQSAPTWWDKAKSIWVHGLEIVRSIWLWLVIGIFISAAIETTVPTSWFETVGSWGLFPAMLLVLVASVPLYVCATASVPIAAAIVAGGLPPAAALVFLMAGPATNVTTIGAIQSRFGWKSLLIYLGTIIIGSMGFAWLFDWLLTAEISGAVAHGHDHQNMFSIACAIVLLVMIGYFGYERWVRPSRSSD